MLTNVNDFNKYIVLVELYLELDFIICEMSCMYREPYRTKINFYKKYFFEKEFEFFFQKLKKIVT